MSQKNKPIAVLISDIHFTPSTLELASQSLLKAQYKAKILDIPLIIAGDTLDSKAIVRAECMNKLLQMFAVTDAPKTYILVGNHDLCNEKGTEHSLNFLNHRHPKLKVVDNSQAIVLNGQLVMLIPYQSDSRNFKAILYDEDTPDIVICHQGIQGAWMGHYVQDKTSLPPETFDGLRVISGHYHRAQTIKCGDTGLFSYIGNPYTLSFAEAEDGPKGYQILMDDGTLEFVSLDLRRHIVIEADLDRWREIEPQDPKNPLWIKITGNALDLHALKKEDVAKVVGHSNFKLDKLYTVNSSTTPKPKAITEDALLDSIIDETSESVDNKTLLKSLWREIV